MQTSGHLPFRCTYVHPINVNRSCRQVKRAAVCTCVLYEHSSRGLIPFFAKNKGIGLCREEFGRNYSKNLFFILYLWKRCQYFMCLYTTPVKSI